jgi:hypothetical protein
MKGRKDRDMAMTELQKEVQCLINNMNAEESGESYRVAYHDTPDGSDSRPYISNWYGIAMHTVPVEQLTNDDCVELLNR